MFRMKEEILYVKLIDVFSFPIQNLNIEMLHANPDSSYITIDR